MPSERAPSSTVCWWPSVCTGMGVILLYYCNSRYGHANGCHQLPCTSRRTRPPRHHRLEQHPAHTCPTLPSSFSRHRLFLEFVQNVTPCHHVPHRAVGFHGNARRGIAHDYCRTSSTVQPLMIAVLVERDYHACLPYQSSAYSAAGKRKGPQRARWGTRSPSGPALPKRSTNDRTMPSGVGS